MDFSIRTREHDEDSMRKSQRDIEFNPRYYPFMNYHNFDKDYTFAHCFVYDNCHSYSTYIRP